MSNTDNIISYAAFLKDRDNFRSAGTNHGSEMNIYDTPSHKFFKLLFYFWNDDHDRDDDHPFGLLAPTWHLFNGSERTNRNLAYHNFDTAWTYLKNNDENERAEKLEQFVTLLSNINSESPWYFNEITGLDAAMDRKIIAGELKMEERKKISIKCLPDAYDNRIETLLGLYRDITWNWWKKCEVLPANLRKFDMGLYIWESPIYGLNSENYVSDMNTILDEDSETYSASFKLIEFHNCEIDYDSIKSGYESINHKEGITNTFTIDIYFDDCYEHSYNSLMMRTIGDVIISDTVSVLYDDNGNGFIYNLDSIPQGQKGSYFNNYDNTLKSEEELTNRLSRAATRQDYPWNGFTNSNSQNEMGNSRLGENLSMNRNSERPDESNQEFNQDPEIQNTKQYADLLPGHKGSGVSNEVFDAVGNEIAEKTGFGAKHELLPGYKGSYQGKGFFGNVISEVVGAVKRDVTSSLNRLFLGNLYTYSISRMSDQLKGLMNGHIFSTLDAVDQYAGTNIMGNMEKHSLSNLTGRGQKLLNEHVNDRKQGRIGNQSTNLGNIYKSQTMANNI